LDATLLLLQSGSEGTCLLLVSLLLSRVLRNILIEIHGLKLDRENTEIISEVLQAILIEGGKCVCFSTVMLSDGKDKSGWKRLETAQRKGWARFARNRDVELLKQ